MKFKENFKSFAILYRDEDIKWMIQQSYNKENCYEVRISYPRITQKSYGTEKRFVSPPPLIEIGGLLCNNDDQSDDRSDQELDSIVCIHLGIMNENAYNLVQFKNYFAARSVFSTDLKFLRETTMNVKIHLKQTGQLVGNFVSHTIDIISKPTVKRSGISGKLIIKSGSSVALYNRIRSQASSTTYIYYNDEQKAFLTSNELWSTVRMFLISVTQSDIENNKNGYICEEGEIKANSKILLRDERYKSSFPPLIIRKIDKNCVDCSRSCNEPIYQFHKYALESASSKSLFLACDRTGSLKLIECKHDNIIKDICRWTLVKAGSRFYKWYSVDKNAQQLCPSIDINLTSVFNTVPEVTVVNVRF
ncbi:hypothetical protein GJ496_003966 [Pomphorhynchus laevis]|nr:hypothetical protein GJ496_003966 [Pomphorhynchus laevis]